MRVFSRKGEHSRAPGGSEVLFGQVRLRLNDL